MMRCSEEYGKQWRPKQGKLEWQKQEEEEKKVEARRKQEEKEEQKSKNFCSFEHRITRTKKKKQKKRKTVEVKRVVEEWEIWDEEEEVAKSKVEVKKLVLEKFHKWIKVFSKKQSEWMPTRKIWDHAIDMKERFVLRKEKVYPLSKEEKEEV